MSNTVILIKKSGTTNKVPLTSDLANGELALNYTDQILYGTNGSVVFEIGSNVNIQIARSELRIGNSTINVFSNSTLLKIANSTTSANLTSISLNIGTSVVNSTMMAAGANAKLVVSGLTVGNSTANSLVNSTSFFLANSSSSILITPNQFSAGFPYSISLGNTTVNLYSNSTSIKISNSTTSSTLTPAQITLGANAFLSTDVISIGNTTVNTVANSSWLRVANSTSTANLTSASLAIGTTTVNTVQITVGANVFLDTVKLSIGNSTVNSFSNSLTSIIANSTTNTVITSSTIRTGNSTFYTTTNTSYFEVIGVGYTQITTAIIGMYDGTYTAILQPTLLHLGNTIANVTINSVSMSVTNATSNVRMTPSDVTKNDVSIIPFGQHTIWMPSVAMTPRTTNGPTVDTLQTATNGVMLKTLSFNASTNDHAQFWIQMPKSWDEGTLVYQVIWSQANTTTNFGVAWALSAVAFADDDPADTAFGTEVIVTDTGGTNNDIYISPESSALTVAGSPAAEELVYFQIKRLPANASDTMTVAARLHGVKIHYTTNAATDD